MNKIISVLCLSMILSMVLSMSLTGVSLASNTRLKIALIADASGVRDHSFNEATYNGLKNIQAKLQGIDVDVFECQEEENYHLTIERLSSSGYNVIIVAGFFLKDVTREVAKEHSKIKYIVVDSPYPEGAYLPNVATISFNEFEVGFLAGTVSGSLTYKYNKAIKGLNRDKKVGIIKGSESSEAVKEFAQGFAQGVLRVCPDCSILSNTLNSFSDKASANKIATQMYKEGVDIIFPIAGFASIGAINSAKENKKFIVGVDVDQSYIAPNVIITSAMKNLESAIEDVISKTLNGQFKFGEDHLYSLEQNGVRLAPYHKFEKNIPKELKDLLKKTEQDIRNKKIVRK